MASDDITSNYHGGNPNSRAANRRTNKVKDGNEIYAWVFRQGLTGATADEADIALRKGHQTTSARFSDLKRDKHLVPLPGVKRLTRKRCQAQVMVAARILEAHLKKPGRRGVDPHRGVDPRQLPLWEDRAGE